MVTHSRWRGDFSKVALAQSCAEAKGATHKISREIKVMRFMVWFLPQTAWLAGNEPKSSRRTRGIVMPHGKARKTSVTQDMAALPRETPERILTCGQAMRVENFRRILGGTVAKLCGCVLCLLLLVAMSLSAQAPGLSEMV